MLVRQTFSFSELSSQPYCITISGCMVSHGFYEPKCNYYKVFKWLLVISHSQYTSKSNFLNNIELGLHLFPQDKFLEVKLVAQKHF